MLAPYTPDDKIHAKSVFMELVGHLFTLALGLIGIIGPKSMGVT